jgi:DNA modification methylase
MSAHPTTPEYLADIPINEDIDQSLLNIENKERSNLFAWKGQFSPQLVEVLLREYAASGCVVLDPFAGSGTVLYESGRFGLVSTAAEINPAACCLARSYELMNLRSSERNAHIQELGRFLESLISHEVEAPEKCLAALLDAQFLSHSHERRILLEALITLVDSAQIRQGKPKIGTTWGRLKEVVDALPYSPAPLKVLNCDARLLPIANGTVDLVITSPPYINVFNYHQQYRPAAEALGWDLLNVAKSEIGSNRKHRANRFLTVVQYCLDIVSALSELNRVCKPNARVIFVVGRESRVRGVPFFNGELVGRLATGCSSFRIALRQERVFKNRFGESIIEDILHLKRLKSSRHSDLFSTADAQAIGKNALKDALKDAKGEVAVDISEAISLLGQVRPSPVYAAGQARKAVTGG